MSEDAQQTAVPRESVGALSYARPGTAKELTPFIRFLLAPIGWFMLSATILLAAWSLWTLRKPVINFEEWMLLSGGWLLLCGVWFVRVAAGAIQVYVSKPPRELYAPGRWRGVAVALIALVTYGLSSADVPLRLGFAISRPAMSNLAARGAAAAPGTTFPNQRVGVYVARGAHAIPGGVRFITGDGFLEHGGFAFSPNGPPPNVSDEDTYRPLGGGWYVWHEHF